MLTELAVRATMILAGDTDEGNTAGGVGAEEGSGDNGHALLDQCSGGIAAPGNLGSAFNDILSWVRWGSLAILTIAFFAAVGMMVWGRVTYHPRGARIGFDALVVCLVAAIIYVSGFSIITSIAQGC